MPADAQAVLTYQDRWTFDFTEYMIGIEVQVTEARTDKVLAESFYKRPSFTGNSPVDMVDAVLAALFKQRGPALPDPPPTPDPYSTAPGP